MKLSLGLALGLVGVVALSGCAAADGVEAEEQNETTESEIGISVPNPSGAYFAKVTAAGTGCMPGSWDAVISPDGKNVSLKFSAYDAAVEPGQAMSVRDCNIGIDLKSPEGLSYAVTSFEITGEADLEQGVSTDATIKYYFQGNPQPTGENRTTLRGPMKDDFVFEKNLEPSELVWSPCGTTRRLNALTRVFTRNNARKTGSGTTSVLAHDASINLNLAWRRCR